jgi:hypothetical protein
VAPARTKRLPTIFSVILIILPCPHLEVKAIRAVRPYSLPLFLLRLYAPTTAGVTETTRFAAGSNENHPKLRRICSHQFALDRGILMSKEFGARVLLRYGAKVQAQCVTSQSSYLSANDPRLHFGLGAATTADLETHWPTGAGETHSGLRADQLVTVREGDGIVRGTSISLGACMRANL